MRRRDETVTKNTQKRSEMVSDSRDYQGGTPEGSPGAGAGIRVMKNFYYNIALFFSWVSEYFSSQKQLFSARHAMLHELVNITMHKDDITKKNPAILLAVGKFDQILINKPSDTQSELGHVLLQAKTRRGKSLNAETNCLTWPYPLIANDIKKELWSRTAGWREKGLGGKAIMFDPRGNGGRFDPLEGLITH